MAPQTGLDIEFPLHAKLLFVRPGRRAEETRLGGRDRFRIGTGRDLAQELGEERIDFADLEGTVVAEDFHRYFICSIVARSRYPCNCCTNNSARSRTPLHKIERPLR